MSSAAAGGARHDLALQALGVQRAPHRRLPNRHGFARESGVRRDQVPGVKRARVDVELHRHTRLHQSVREVDHLVAEELEAAHVDVRGRQPCEVGGARRNARSSEALWLRYSEIYVRFKDAQTPKRALNDDALDPSRQLELRQLTAQLEILEELSAASQVGPSEGGPNGDPSQTLDS